MTAATIIATCSSIWGISPDAITGPARHLNISEARHLSAWLMRHHLRMSNTQIAAAINRKCHGAAVHSITRATNLMTTDKHYNRIAQRVFAALGINDGVAA